MYTYIYIYVYIPMASGDKMESAKNKKSDLGVLGDNPDLSGVSAMPPPV
jgi:hypothetical protein